MSYANVLKYLQKKEGLSDAQLAQMVEIKEKRLSKILASKQSLSIEEIDHICDTFSLTPNVFETGIIKSKQNREQDQETFDKFAIPAHYKQYAKSSGFLRQIYIDSFKQILGEEAFEIFCAQEGVDPLYFIDWANAIHPDFNLKLMKELARKNMLDDQLMGKIATEYVFNTIGNISKLDIPARMSAANNWVNMLNKIEKCHQWDVLDCTDHDIEFAFYPFDFMDLNLYKNDAFLKDAKERYIQAFASHLINLPVEIKQSFIGGAEKTILSTKVKK